MENLDYEVLVPKFKAELDKLRADNKMYGLKVDQNNILIQKLTVTIDTLVSLINTHSSSDHTTTISKLEFVYPKDETWEERVKSYMKFKNKAIKTAQIINEFKQYESGYTEDKLKGAINNCIQSMLKKRLLRVYEPEIKTKGYYFANPLWFEGESLKEEHKPDLIEITTW